MTRRVNRAVAALAGITLTLTSSDPLLMLGSSTDFSLKLTNNGESSVRVRYLTLDKWGDLSSKAQDASLNPHSSLTFNLGSIPTPAQAQVNLPHAEHLYDGNLFGKDFTVTVQLQINKQPVAVSVSKQMDVAPPVEIESITPSHLILTPETIKRPVTFNLRVINHQNASFEGELSFTWLTASPHPTQKGKSIYFNQGDATDMPLRLSARETQDVKATLTNASELLDVYRSGGYHDLLVSFTIFGGKQSPPSAPTKNVYVAYSDARVAPNLHVGYVRSTDETLRNALHALGVESQELTVEDIRSGDLSKYDTIIIDNRGYQLHTELVAANSRLLDYAKNGGTLMVFYHKSNEWNPDASKSRPQLAPLPITLGGERVTDENAPITFTEAQHPLLNLPNTITQDDFKGWIQERGLYYPKTWDAGYHAPLAMSDAGEESLRGGLLTLDYGRGRYIYTSMVWYRQLRAGIPGAYRVFANMISYGHAATKKKGQPGHGLTRRRAD